jgi:trehalose 2-sulfotransferase
LPDESWPVYLFGVTMTRNAVGPTDSYFICATPRTGSSLLLGLLESTDVAGRPEAYFRAPDEAMWADRWHLPGAGVGAFDYADFVRAARIAGSTENGVFGAKLMWGTLDEVVDKLGTVHPDLAGEDAALLQQAFGRARFVLLQRDDVVAQAVSWLRAEQTGTWHIGDPGTNGQSPGYDRDGIAHFVQTIEAHNAAWEEWFASVEVRPHRVRYEALQADLVGVTRGILDFLGLELPEGHSIVPRHRRQADDLNEEWIARYRVGIR